MQVFNTHFLPPLSMNQAKISAKTATTKYCLFWDSAGCSSMQG